MMLMCYIFLMSGFFFQKQQQKISKENEFYQNLLLDALPFDRITGSIISSQEIDDGGNFMCEIFIFYIIRIFNTDMSFGCGHF